MLNFKPVRHPTEVGMAVFVCQCVYVHTADKENN